MKIKAMLLGAALAVGSLLTFSSEAHAQDVTLRLEPAFATPLNKPQLDHYEPGAAMSMKLDFHLSPWVDVFPGVSVVALSTGSKYTPPSASATTNLGVAWSYGAGIRVSRPHDYDHNHNHGIDAVAPWVDVQPSYVRTGDLNRFGVQASAGLYAPTDDSRWLWTGPFIGFQQITDGSVYGNTAGKDTTDSRVAMIGWGFEFGGVQHQKTAPPTEATKDKPEIKVTPVPVVEELQPPPTHNVVMMGDLDLVIPFAYDSAVVSTEYLDQIKEFSEVVVEKLAAHPDLKIAIGGHASDEGHKWAATHNQALSTKRAETVRDYMIAAGVPADILTVRGFGTTRPAEDNATEEGRQANRRVEFFVVVTLSCTDEGDCE